MAEGGEKEAGTGTAAEGSARARARHRRRADALRANLTRRKTQARQRGAADGKDTAPADNGDDGSGG